MSYSEPLINQPRVLFLSIGIGVLLCVFYVTLQGVFRLLGEGKLSYYIADAIFVTVFTLVSFFFMVLYNNGRVRLHLIMGEAAGFFAFYLTAGKYLYGIIRRMSECVAKTVRFVLKPYSIVFGSFAGGVKKIFGKLKNKLKQGKDKKEDEPEGEQKKRKNFDFFGKIHLKNYNKSV